jgi:Septum formation
VLALRSTTLSKVGGGTGDDQEHGDPFEDLVLDEGFVRGAHVVEPPARRRQPRQPRHWGHRFRNWWRGWGVLVIIVAAIAGAFAYSRWWRSSHRTSLTPAPTLPTTVPGPGSTTSTTIALVGRSYSPGDCVTWDQNNPGLWSTETRVVPCSSTHLVEIVGRAALTDMSSYPSEQQWAQIREERCAPEVAPYLGHGLDPFGKFGVGFLYPLPNAWAAGSREIWCGIAARPAAGTDLSLRQFQTFAGAVKGQDQTYLYGTGACLPMTPGPSVPCTGPHGVEVSGTADLHGQVQRPRTSSEWAAAVGPACDTAGRSYVGGTYPVGVRWGWLNIEESSWSAGRRIVECTVGVYDANNNLVVSPGPIRH